MAPSSAGFDLSRSELPFGEALTALVREVEDDLFVTARGLKINTFAEMLEGVSSTTLAAAVAGAAPPSPRLMEECARFLRVRPEYFREYREALPQAA
ncbi:MAG: hypothetical protein JO073_11905 [Actinobacteria bacterium]|nr:hypothetical protein [Actinomycetota bacterium]